MNWKLVMRFHWPHDRFCLGWQIIKPNEEEKYWTLTFYLFIVTIDLDIE